MYQVFLGTTLLPVAPSKIEMSIGSRSQTVELINGDEINIVKGASLAEISFEFMVPAQRYPFATYSTSLDTAAILAQLDTYKTQRLPFQFIVVRVVGTGRLKLHTTNIKVTLEDYTVDEDAENGLDAIISVRLKEYKAYSTKVYDEKNQTVKKTRA